MEDFARVLTQGSLGSALVVAGNEQSVRIHGYVISNTGGSSVDVTVQTTESSPSTIAVYSLTTRETVVVDIPFIADKGFQIAAATSDIEATVHHSNVGA